MDRKVTLLSPYTDLTSFGLRSVSANLKKSGIGTSIVFMIDPEDLHIKSNRQMNFYSEKIIQEIAEISEGSLFIGISLMSCFFDKIRDLTVRLKNYTDIPVVWGGIHAFIDWEESCRYADFTVVGDGEITACRLASLLLEKDRDNIKESDIKSIPNLTYAKKGELIYKSDTLGLVIENLDSIPIPDIDPENKYLTWNNELIPFTSEYYYDFQIKNPLYGLEGEIYYQTLSSRGCPHSCTYCSNNLLRRLSRGKYLRFRSPGHIIEELRLAIKIYDKTSYIVFSDDSFFAMSRKNIAEFASLYKKLIKLPFRCLVSPTTIDEEKLDLFVECGLKSIQMGIESGSPETLELYKRAGSLKAVENSINMLNRFKDRIDPPIYDFIVDNPFEPEKNRIETLKFMLNIPRPFRIQLFSLILFPKTELYDKYIKENLSNSRSIDIKNRQFFEIEINYINILMIMIRKNFPLPIIKIFSNKLAIRLFGFRPVGRALYLLIAALKKIKRIYS